MNNLLSSLIADKLVWLPELGIGYYPVPDTVAPYDAGYWQKYIAMDATPVGEQLNKARMYWVKRYWSNQDDLVDVGIGGGNFVKFHGCKGYDVSEYGLRWLRDNERLHDPYARQIGAATFWDSLEHIANIEELIANVRDWVFMSLPIFDSAEHVQRSKHYRKDEHVWYFTHEGIIGLMARLGFVDVACCHMEEDCGREDIGTYAFRRVTKG